MTEAQMASIALGKHEELFIKKQLASGEYDDASDVVRTALHMLEEYDDARERWLCEDVSARFDEMEAAPEKAVALENVFDRLETIHAARLSKGK
jgi:antitoxin ParD1/3/4